MKITPVAQGTGVPANSTQTQPNADKMIRAKAIASGQTAPEIQTEEQPTGDRQVDRIRKIKMRTNVSPDRPTETIEQEVEVQPEEIPQSDTSEPVQVVEETKPLSPQFAALAKAKRALQVKERELAQKEQALADKSQVNLEEYVSKADLKANPLKIFETGITYDQLTEAILANQSGHSPEISQLKADIQSLKEELTGQFTQRDTQAEQQVLGQLKKEAEILTSHGDEYEAIRQAKAQQLVVDLIHRNFKQTGELMDLTEAADLVENQLIDEALPFAKIKKVQSRLTPLQEAIQEQQQQLAPKPNTKVMRTLTNRDGARPGPMDRRARALAAFNGTFKRG